MDARARNLKALFSMIAAMRGSLSGSSLYKKSLSSAPFPLQHYKVIEKNEAVRTRSNERRNERCYGQIFCDRDQAGDYKQR